MCCFSSPVDSVSSTRIFARGFGDRQSLVYEMELSARKDLAMILPLPTTDVHFINLEEFPTFFNHLSNGFPKYGESNSGGSREFMKSALRVESVGSFEASFVPTAKDFDRLDECFRLPSGVWDKLPQYRSFGFAVFKLKSSSHKFHPMAFSFQKTFPQLFFPTVHVHDGEVHAKAHFDHVLYAQADKMLDWQESGSDAREFMNVERSQGIVDGNSTVFRREMVGSFKNQDVLT